MIWKELGLIVFGALIGFAATEVSAWRRIKEDKKEKANDIIANVVNFVTKANERANDVIINMNYFNKRLFNAPSLDAKQAKEQKDSYLLKVSDEATDFFVELNFHSFQLKRIGNQDIWKRFEALMNVYDKLFKVLLKKEKEFELAFAKEESNFKKLYKKFINHCIKISKINAS